MDTDVPYVSNKTRASLATYFGSDSMTLALSGGSNVLTMDTVVAAYVGDDVHMSSRLDILAQTSYALSRASHANVDAWNTGIFSLESLTPSVTYTTDSGYMYRPQAVPEPATMAALGLGVVAMIRRRKRS